MRRHRYYYGIRVTPSRARRLYLVTTSRRRRRRDRPTPGRKGPPCSAWSPAPAAIPRPTPLLRACPPRASAAEPPAAAAGAR
eukprot:422324-Prorocentrum_minimum.AAC.1